jgi:large subunit ribosomal protein L21
MAYAIIQSGGRQVRVEPGAVVAVDHLPDTEKNDGDGDRNITFDRVLFLGSGDNDGSFVAGSPHVAGARVTGIVEGDALGKKIRVFTKKRRGGMRRTIGHRTQLTRIRITGIETA